MKELLYFDIKLQICVPRFQGANKENFELRGKEKGVELSATPPVIQALLSAQILRGGEESNIFFRLIWLATKTAAGGFYSTRKTKSNRLEQNFSKSK
jgi:hypothetical protein